MKTERQTAISCLLDMNCISVGMEQLPASSLSQWEYIKKMIDMSDYYLLIVFGQNAGMFRNVEHKAFVQFYTEEAITQVIIR